MKYKGSKRRLMKYFNPIFNEYKQKHNLITFVDLFCGGANVVSSVDFENKIANDNDPILISLLKAMQNDNDRKCIEQLPTPDRESFNNAKYAVRDKEYGDFPLYTFGAILFFGSFNARAYGGDYGATTITKDGKKRDYFQEAKRNLLKQNVENIQFTNFDYKEVTIPNNSLIYIDPPYKNTTGYLQKKFNHNEMWDWIREKSKNNIIIISELDAPEDFEIIWEKEIIHGQNQPQKMLKTEKLFIHSKGMK